MLRIKVFKIFLPTLMLFICFSFSGLVFAGDCANGGFGHGVPSITSNYHYSPGWFDMEQKLTLPSTGQIVTTQFIPSGATVNLNISGVVGFWVETSYGLDAAYIYYVPPGTIYYPVTDPIRSLIIQTSNGRFDPQPPEYNQNHEYDWQTLGTGQSMTLKVGDSHYEDNSGSFAVTVTW